AFAHPGTVHRLVPAPENPASPVALDASLELVVRLFVDQAVTFCVADSESDAVAVYLTSETHARRAPLRDADFVVVPARADAQTASEAVAEACRGTLVSPEKGATLLMGCARLAGVPESGEVTEPAVHVVALQGPGVERENRFAVDRVDWLRARDARGDEFPCGIEIVLVDPEGRIAAVPRSSSARRLADPATGFGADPASDLARDAATNPAPGLDPSTDPASMFHVKQSTQCSATKEQMFHVKHSESVPAEGFAPAATAASAAKGVR
ncbi:MAG: phosphonate C-P lyase system protein PhnH, partial [Eggerthella sp.]|nr:phosphonate C-P lyase system protein PhnH [Eggerthella sp.]